MGFMEQMGWKTSEKAPDAEGVKALSEQVAALTAKIAAMPASQVTVVPPMQGQEWQPPTVAPLDLVTNMPDPTLEAEQWAAEMSRRTQVYQVSFSNARDEVNRHNADVAAKNTNLVDTLYDTFNQTYAALKPNDEYLGYANQRVVNQLAGKGMTQDAIKQYVIGHRDEYLKDVADAYKTMFVPSTATTEGAAVGGGEEVNRTDGILSGGTAHGSALPTNDPKGGNTGFLADLQDVQKQMKIF